MRRWFLQGLLPTCLAILGFLGVLVVGQWAREALRGDSAHQFAFSDIECPSPVARSREEFLAEVQYLSGFSDRLDLLDPTLAQRLEAAFIRDPWVAEVQRIEVGPHSIKANLRCRVAVLAVPVEGVQELRLVDGEGIQLTGERLPPRLFRFGGKATKPQGLPGTVWGDVHIADAARLAAVLQPHFDSLCGTQTRDVMPEIYVGDDTIIVLKGSIIGHIIWGHSPGKERADEDRAAEKLRALLHSAEEATSQRFNVLDLSKAKRSP